MNKLVIGVDIGGTRTKYGLVNTTTGEVVHSIVQPTEKIDAEIFLQQVGDVIKGFRMFAAQSASDLLGIGFGVPGYVNEEGMVETTYGFLAFMESYPLKTIIENRFSLNCFLDNDARAVSLGEAMYGKGKNYKRVLTLTLGTGVGFGFVVNGKFTEQMPLAHMAGHITITDEGEICYCGKKGCLEALISSTGIINLAKKYNWTGEPVAEKIFEAALQGDKTAVNIVEKIITYLHTGIHNYVNLFAPDIIVLGGGIAKGLAPYLDKLKGKSYLSPHPRYTFQLAVSALQEQAGMLGSAALINTIQSSEI
jgi:glucokinase